MAELTAMFERKLSDLESRKEQEKDSQRRDLEKIIEELKALLEDEKKKMGEAGMVREK